MEVIEILIYISVAIIVGGLLIFFISGWDVDTVYQDISALFRGKSDDFIRLERDLVPSKLHDIFVDCTASGEAMETSFYVTGEGNLTIQDIFSVYKDIGWCDTIQSNSQNCGIREDIVMNDIILPRVVHVNCTGRQLFLS